MKLKKAESEMLPVWVLSGVYTKPFFAWLNEAGESNTWEHQNNTVVKMRQGNFIYLYLQKGAGKNLVPGHDLKFAGLFVRKNYNLYDVDMELAVLLGLPEEIGFPCRIDIRREAEERASQKADEILEMYWQEFLFQSGLDTKSLIPLVVRSEIRELLSAGQESCCYQIRTEDFFGGIFFRYHVFVVLGIWRAGGRKDCKAVDQTEYCVYFAAANSFRLCAG